MTLEGGSYARPSACRHVPEAMGFCPFCGSGGATPAALFWRTGEAGKNLGGIEDADVVKGAEGEQVLIAGDDHIGLGSDGEGQEFVVIRVAADRHRQGRRVDHFGELEKFGQDLRLRTAGPPQDGLEFWPPNHLGEFRQQSRRQNKG